MISELIFLQLFLDRKNYTSYRSYLPRDILEPQTTALLGYLDMWYKHNDQGNPSTDDLYNMALPHMPKEDLTQIISNIKGITNTYSAQDALKEFTRNHLYQDLSVAAYDAAEGRSGAMQKIASIQASLDTLDSDMEAKESPFLTATLEELLLATDRTQGIKWRLQVLRKYLGNLIPGDFGFFAARPETGKTTMLASEASYMVEQLKDGNRPLIWFNNEETGSKVMVRIYQAVLGWTDEHVRANIVEAERQYLAKTNGMLRFVDRDYLQKGEVESICADYHPRIIILDQIDPIKGFKADREDLRLGEIYKWARALTKRHGMSTIAVCQADVSAENKEYLHMDNVANAKTEKQAAADFIIGIGKTHNPSFERIRYLSFMKNKLTGHHTRHEVLIKPEIGRYEDL